MARCNAQHLTLSSICLFVATTFTGCPQPDSLGWVYNGDGRLTGFRVFGNEDGEVIAVGEARDSIGEKSTVYVRFGEDGSILANRIIPDLRNPVGFPTPAATLLSNGDVLLAATAAQGNNAAESRLRVLRIDPDGHTLWDTTLGDIELTPKVAVESDMGDILLAGNRSDGGFPNLFFIRLAADGSLNGYDELTALDDRSNVMGPVDGEWIGGAFVLTGAYPTEVSPGQYGNAISVLRLDSSSNVLTWIRTIGTYNDPIGIERLGDNLAILTYRSDSPVRLVTTDADGNFLSVSEDLFVPANPDERSGATDFIVDSSGDIVMVGEGTTVHYVGDFFPQISIRPFLAKFTADGEKIWETTIDAYGTIVNGVTETSDGGYATTGATPDAHLNVILFDHDGNIIN